MFAGRNRIDKSFSEIIWEIFSVWFFDSQCVDELVLVDKFWLSRVLDAKIFSTYPPKMRFQRSAFNFTGFYGECRTDNTTVKITEMASGVVAYVAAPTLNRPQWPS